MKPSLLMHIDRLSFEDGVVIVIRQSLSVQRVVVADEVIIAGLPSKSNDSSETAPLTELKS
jgi:hypothetical protein